MKRLGALFLALTLVAGCFSNFQSVAYAMEGVYVDSNGTTQYAKAATAVRYNDDVMTGMGLSNVKDGNYETTYVSEDNPDMSGQYIQLEWDEPINVDQLTLYATYCGASGKAGQAPTKWTIEAKTDGEASFHEVCKVEQTWEANDEIQSKNTQFTLQEDVVAIRVVITEANLDWNHYVVSELEIGKTKEAVNVGVYEDGNGTTQYAKAAATVTYNDGVMTGNGLENVKDGDYTTTYVSEDNPNMSAQYIEYTWNVPIDINQVTLYSQYCGASGKAGQAPTKWTIEAKTDGAASFHEVCKVEQTWEANDEVQSKNVKFDLQEKVKALRVVITEANLDWSHYAISEIEVGKAKEAVNVGVYEDGNGTTQYAKAAATVTYNDGVMTGNGLGNVKDGDYTTTYVSEDNPNMSAQYIQYTWNAPIDVNLVTLYSLYCGAEDKAGQAPTKWTIEVSKDGTTFNEVCKVTKEWKSNDELQSANKQFALQEDVKALRVVITEANLDWSHYAIAELEVGKTQTGFTPSDITGESEGPQENVGVYEDGNGTTQYAKAAATVTYNDGVMTGNGLGNVKDGDYTTTYVSEDNPNMSAQYIQYTWNAPIDLNLVTLYSLYCGAEDKDGQAPTKWTIEVSKDGTTFNEVCKVTKEWKSNDELQSANKQFALQEDVKALRVVITEANLDWSHYAIAELEVGKTQTGFTPSDITGESEGPQENIGVYEDGNGTTQYAKAAATVTYNDGVMTGNGLGNVKDGDYTTTYVSEDNPNMSAQYIQYTWNAPIDVNLVTLYSQYCGTANIDGQAPIKWTIEAKKDGTTEFYEVCKVEQVWKANDNLQSKNAQFELQKDIIALKVIITEANLDWNHYAISELEVGKTKAGFIPVDITGTEGTSGNVGVYTDANGTTQYAKAAIVTYNEAVMSGQGLLNVIDGNRKTTYVSEDKPKMKGQYIQFTWNEPIEVNTVSLYSQYCGTKYKDGQAPTKWTIEVSKDGTTFDEVCKVTKKWRSNDNVQSKAVQFDSQKDVVAMRILITEAELDWSHYAISEIEIGLTKAGYIVSDVTGLGKNVIGITNRSKSPQTGDASTPIYWIIVMGISVLTVGASVYKRKKYE